MIDLIFFKGKYGTNNVIRLPLICNKLHESTLQSLHSSMRELLPIFQSLDSLFLDKMSSVISSNMTPEEVMIYIASQVCSASDTKLVFENYCYTREVLITTVMRSIRQQAKDGYSYLFDFNAPLHLCVELLCKLTEQQTAFDKLLSLSGESDGFVCNLFDTSDISNAWHVRLTTLD